MKNKNIEIISSSYKDNSDSDFEESEESSFDEKSENSYLDFRSTLIQSRDKNRFKIQPVFQFSRKHQYFNECDKIKNITNNSIKKIIKKNINNYLDNTNEDFEFFFPNFRKASLLKQESSKLKINYFKKKFNYKMDNNEKFEICETKNEILNPGDDINSSFVIKSSDLNRLSPEQWLNDTIINFFVTIFKSQLYKTKSKKFFAQTLNDFYIFNTFFSYNINNFILNHEKLYTLNDEDKINEETKIKEKLFKTLKYIHSKEKIKLTNYNHIFIPFHHKDHWLLYLVFNLKNFYKEINEQKILDIKKIKNKLYIISLDSLNSSLYKIMDGVKEVLNLILIGKIKKDKKINLSINKKILNEDNVVNRVLRVPFQENNYDCGLAVLENIERIINSDPDFFSFNDKSKIDYNSEIFTEKRKWFIYVILEMENKINMKTILDHYFEWKKDFEKKISLLK